MAASPQKELLLRKQADITAAAARESKAHVVIGKLALQIHTIHHAQTRYKIHNSHAVTVNHRKNNKKRYDIWGYSLFKKPITDGTKDYLYLLTLPMGGLNLHPDGKGT